MKIHPKTNSALGNTAVMIQCRLLAEHRDVTAQQHLKRRVLKNTFTEHKVEVE